MESNFRDAGRWISYLIGLLGVLAKVCSKLLGLCVLLYSPTAVVLWSLIQYGQQEDPLDSMTCQQRSLEHGLLGNPDFYGLGIRIGIYLQWLATAVSFMFFPKFQQGLLASYLALTVAMFIALLLLVFRTACTFTAEIIVVLYMTVGGWITTFTVKDLRYGKPSAEEAAIQFDLRDLRGLDLCFHLLGVTTLPASAWFWMRIALRGEVDFFETPDGTAFFLIRKIENPQVQPAACFLVFISMWIPATPLFLQQIEIPLRRLHFDKTAALVHMLTFEFAIEMIFKVYTFVWVLIVFASAGFIETVTRTKQISNWFTRSTEEQRQRCISGARSVGCTVWTIVAIELTLKWNRIDDVSEVASTGQLIPLVVGLTIILSTLWQVYRKRVPIHDSDSSSYESDRGSEPTESGYDTSQEHVSEGHELEGQESADHISEYYELQRRRNSTDIEWEDLEMGRGFQLQNGHWR